MTEAEGDLFIGRVLKSEGPFPNRPAALEAVQAALARITDTEERIETTATVLDAWRARVAAADRIDRWMMRVPLEEQFERMIEADTEVLLARTARNLAE